MTSPDDPRAEPTASTSSRQEPSNPSSQPASSLPVPQPQSSTSTSASTPISLSTSSDMPQSNTPNSEAVDYEATHVHSVYDAIAPHFSATRHKPWPRVTEFLTSLPPGAVGLDVGCGNGKYIDVNPNVHILASDRSEALVRLARQKKIPYPTPSSTTTDNPSKRDLKESKDKESKDQDPRASITPEVLVADGLSLPYRPSSVDFIISIAVIHHLSTRTRRRAALSSLLACARPQAPVLVYAWALEQSSSRRGFHAGCDQDTLVPWVMRAPKGSDAHDATYQRYYHLYRQGELDEDVAAVGAVVVDSGYERDNWWVVCSREHPRPEGQGQTQDQT